VHHRPAGSPLSARMAGALTRSLVRTRRSARRRGGRLGLGMALSTAVTGFVLAVPVVSSDSPTTPMSMDSATSSTARHAEESSPVVMGRDGTPAPPAAGTPAAPPASEVPGSEVPGSEVPASELPASELPASEVPASEVPASDVPASSADAPVTPQASAAAPGTETDTPAPSRTAAASSAGARAPGVEAQVIALVNALRLDAGCAPLVHDEGLAKVARAHSADMRDRDFFDHENLAGLDPFERAEAAGLTNARAENIAYGQPDPAAVMDDWMESKGHRANILDCELRTLGVGVAEGPGGPWWTQLFGD
jgi:uncharacterized protein YkwD